MNSFVRPARFETLFIASQDDMPEGHRRPTAKHTAAAQQTGHPPSVTLDHAFLEPNLSATQNRHQDERESNKRDG